MTEEDPWVPYENKVYWFVAIGFLIIVMIFWIILNEDLLMQLLGLSIIPVILFGAYLYRGTYKITTGGMGKAYLLDYLDLTDQNKVNAFFVEVEDGLSVTMVPNTYHETRLSAGDRYHFIFDDQQEERMYFQYLGDMKVLLVFLTKEALGHRSDVDAFFDGLRSRNEAT